MVQFIFPFILISSCPGICWVVLFSPFILNDTFPLFIYSYIYLNYYSFPICSSFLFFHLPVIYHFNNWGCVMNLKKKGSSCLSMWTLEFICLVLLLLLNLINKHRKKWYIHNLSFSYTWTCIFFFKFFLYSWRVFYRVFYFTHCTWSSFRGMSSVFFVFTVVKVVFSSSEDFERVGVCGYSFHQGQVLALPQKMLRGLAHEPWDKQGPSLKPSGEQIRTAPDPPILTLSPRGG